MTPPKDRFLFWTHLLSIASLLFALQSASWVLLGSFDPFGIYDAMLAKTFWGKTSFHPEAKQAFRFAISLLGATTSAFFVLFFFIVRHAFRRREPWAHQALLFGTIAWFVMDSSASFALGATFNLWLVNLPCLLILVIPLFATRKAFHR